MKRDNIKYFDSNYENIYKAKVRHIYKSEISSSRQTKVSEDINIYVVNLEFVGYKIPSCS